MRAGVGAVRVRAGLRACDRVKPAAVSQIAELPQVRVGAGLWPDRFTSAIVGKYEWLWASRGKPRR